MSTRSESPFAATADIADITLDDMDRGLGDRSPDPVDETRTNGPTTGDDDATRVYLSVIRMPRPTRELLLAQGIPAGRLDSALHALALRGLLSVSAAGVIDVPPPSTSIPQHALELERRAGMARAAADNLSKIYYAARSQALDSMPGIEVLPDLESVGTATNEAVALAEERVRAIRGLTARTRELLRAPLASHREPTVGLGGGTVKMDTVWDATVLELPGALTALSARRDGGEEQRSIALVPITIIVIDDAACLVEWTGEEDGPQGLLGRTRGAVAAGAAMFNRFWQLATPLRDDGDGDLDARDMTFLRLMAAGVPDAAIARQTGFSQRTVERRIRHVMDRLGAQTRFQAGVQAVHRGWL